MTPFFLKCVNMPKEAKDGVKGERVTGFMVIYSKRSPSGSLASFPVWADIQATSIHHTGLYPAHTAHACTCMHIATQGTFLQTQHRRRGTQSNAPLRPKDVNGAHTDSRPPELLSLPARWSRIARKNKTNWEGPPRLLADCSTALGGSLRMIL